MVGEKSKPIKEKNCLNMQLSYQVTDEYLNSCKFFKYKLNASFEKLIECLNNWAEDTDFKQRWMIKSMVKLPQKVSQFEPWSFLDFSDVDFYSYDELSQGSLERIKYILLGNVNDFIKKNNINLNIDEECDYIQSIVTMDEVKEHEKLIKAKLILDICYKPFIYDNKEYRFMPCHNPNGGLEAVSEVIMYAVKDEEDENGKIKKGEIYKVSFVIKPNLVMYNGKMYFEPDIVLRRYVEKAINGEYLGTQSRKNRVINIKHTLYIKRPDRYLTIRIVKNDKYDENTEYDEKSENSYPIKFYYEDFALKNCLLTKEKISIKYVLDALTKKIEDDNILLAYHTSMNDEISTGIGSGVHVNDKILIHNHILSCCIGTRHLESFKCIPIRFEDYHKFREKSKITSVAIDEGKVDFNKIRIKKDIDNLNLYIFKSMQQSLERNGQCSAEMNITKMENYESIQIDEEVALDSINDKRLNITKYIDEFFQYPTIILTDVENTNFSKEETRIKKINNNIDKLNKLNKSKSFTTKIGREMYLLHLQNRDLTLNIIEVEDKDIISRKKNENETALDRVNIIKRNLGSFEDNSIALVELKHEHTRMDSKNILRDALNHLGIVNQFIIPVNSTSKMNNKTRASLLDLFNDFGFTNANIKLNDKIIYSFGYIDLNPDINEIYGDKITEEINKGKQVISFVIRMDDDTIEVKPMLEQYSEQWIHISEMNNILYRIKKQRGTSLDIPFKKDEEILEEIKKVIEEDERNKIIIISHQLKFSEVLVSKMFENIENSSVVQTCISKTEVAQVNSETGKAGILKCVYKLNNCHYRSVGEKTIGMKQNANEYKFSDFTKEYKYRNLFDIKIIKSNIDNDLLASIVHSLRNTITTKVHLNTDILTEHIISFKKHLF